MAGKEHGKDIIDFKTAAWQSESMVGNYVKTTLRKPLDESSFSFMADIYKLHIEPGLNVLDVGCGSGRLTIALHDHGCRVVGTDVSQAMLDALDRLQGDRGIATRCSDGHTIAADDGEFDAVVSMDFMPHFPDWPALLAEKARCCKPGGLVVFNFQSREHREFAAETGRMDYEHIYSSSDEAKPNVFYTEYNAQEISAACAAAGLEIVRFYPYGFFWTHYNLMIGHALGQDGAKQFTEQIAQWMQSDEVRKFAYWFERTVVRNLPAFMTHEHVTVCRKL